MYLNGRKVVADLNIYNVTGGCKRVATFLFPVVVSHGVVLVECEAAVKGAALSSLAVFKTPNTSVGGAGGAAASSGGSAGTDDGGSSDDDTEAEAESERKVRGCCGVGSESGSR